MAFSQFDLSKMMRCHAVNEEGYGCFLSPSHTVGHRWNRCETVDREGHRCMLSLHHSGSHRNPWYDRTVTPGELHIINYPGTESETSALADLAEPVATRYGWVVQSRSFRPGLPWRLALLRPLFANATPSGQLTVVFERGPSESQGIDGN